MPRRKGFATTAAVLALGAPAAATFAVSSTNGSGLPVSTATLAPPTGPAAAAGCGGLLTARVSLSWTATPTTWATGYAIRRRAPLGIWSTIGTVGDRATTTFTDTGALALGTTYEYAVQSTYRSWTADSTTITATTPAVC